MSSTTRSSAELEFEADDEAGSVEEDNSARSMAMEEDECEPFNLLTSGDGLLLDESISVGQLIEIPATNDDDTAEVDSMPDGTNSSEAEIFVNSASTSLNNLLGYGSDCDLELDHIENLEDGLDFIFGDESSVSSFNSDKGDVGVPDDDTDDIQLPNHSAKNMRKRDTLDEALKQLGELSIDDLPPVIHPEVEVNSEDCDLIGQLGNTLGKLVMVESIPNKPAYDIDTLLFLDNGKRPLGYIFDVMGPVHNPIYAIRFNTEEEISALNLSVGMSVYSAPQTEHSRYVFVQQLMKEKGSDASWKNDLEVPSDLLDFSDDENELDGSGLNRKRNSLERHQQFEEDMNMRNVIDTRMHKVRVYTPPKMRRPQRSRRNRRGRGSASRGHAGRGSGARVSPVTVSAGQPLGILPAWAPMGHQFTHIPPPPPPRPAFHTPAAAGSQCAYPQSPFNLAPYSMPPLLAPVPMYMPHVSQMQFTVPPPPPGLVYHGVPPVAPPPSTQAGKTTQPSAAAMMYPPDMGLPPVQPNPSLVPNVQYFGPPVMWHNYATTQGAPHAQPVAAGAGGNQNDMRSRNRFNKGRRK